MDSSSEYSDARTPPAYTPKAAPPPVLDPPPGYQPYQGLRTQTQIWQTGRNSYGATTTTVTGDQPDVVYHLYPGDCPACSIGRLEDDYTCLGILCAIFCFPLGIIACLLLKNRRCPNCGAFFG